MRLGFMLLMGCMASSAPAEPRAKVVGQIGMIQGMVILDSERARNGAKVKEGSVIEVREDSRATLILGQGTVFHLAAGSKMVVNEFGVVSETEERGNLDLKYGRTRALILNQGGKREIRIRSRAVTMGVRGTEIFIDAPKESTRPLRYFTIEGSAEVRLLESAPPIPLNQNQGLSTRGEAPAASGKEKAPQAPVSEALKPSELKGAIRDSAVSPGIPPVAGNKWAYPLPPGAGKGLIGQLSDQYGAGPLAPVALDPVLDRDRRLKVNVQFCNATSGACN